MIDKVKYILSDNPDKKRSMANKFYFAFYLILKLLPKFLSYFIIDLFRNSSFLIGYIFRKAAYKRLMKKMGENVTIEPNVFIDGIENLSVGNGVVIQKFAVWDCRDSYVTIEDNVAIAAKSSIFTGKHNYINYDAKTKLRKSGNTRGLIIIKRSSWIGCNVTILQNVVIGEGSVIGANSLVNINVDSFCVYGGVPIKKIKEFKPKYI